MPQIQHLLLQVIISQVEVCSNFLKTMLIWLRASARSFAVFELFLSFEEKGSMSIVGVKKPKKMKRSKGSGRKVAALNYENICKMRFLNLLKLEYP